MNKIIEWWAIAAGIFLLLFWVAIRARSINWRGLFFAIAEGMADIACQLRIDISGFFKRKRKIELDDYERKLL